MNLTFIIANSEDHDATVLRYRGSYMNAHVLLNLLNKLGKSHKIRAFYHFFPTSLINSIIQKHEC